MSNPAGAKIVGQLSKDFHSYSKLAVQFEQKIPKVAVPPAIYDGTIEDSMFLFDNGKMKMNMDLDMNGHAVINSKEKEYFYIVGYYKSSVRANFILFGNNEAFTKVPFTGYLIGVEVINKKDAPANDNKFVLRIVGRDNAPNRATTRLISTDNSK